MVATPIRVVAADDHPLALQGLCAIVSAEGDMVLVGHAADGQAVVDVCCVHQPDVVIMDVRMPRMDGLQAAAALRLVSPGVKVVMLTTHAGDMQARLALRAGACGYLPKSALRHDLVRAIRDVAGAGPERRAGLFRELGSQDDDGLPTQREIEVLEAVAAGHPNAKVAADLGVGEETVKSHLKRVCAKLGARGRTHAVMLGYRRGVLAPPSWT